jgi:hypothetical protein
MPCDHGSSCWLQSLLHFVALVRRITADSTSPVRITDDLHPVYLSETVVVDLPLSPEPGTPGSHREIAKKEIAASNSYFPLDNQSLKKAA